MTDQELTTKIVINDKLCDITPEILAVLFCSLDSAEQARFYNKIADQATTWGKPFEFQLQYITDEDGLELKGRRVMQAIGDYSHWGLVP